MGWQSRLKKDKPKFVKTCNKCNGTGVARTYISVAGIDAQELVKCKCQIPKVKVVKEDVNAVVVESEDTLALEASG